MITKFRKYNEMVSAEDMQQSLNFGIEKSDAQQTNPNAPVQKDPNIQKTANLKVTDIQNRINQITQQKKLINDEIIRLQGAQRDLAPNNPSDPQNAQKLKVFTDDQQEKIKIQQQKLKVLDDEIKNLQNEVSRHKQNYM